MSTPTQRDSLFARLDATRFGLPALLALAVVLAYLPSLAGGFLDYDDPWLIVDNPVLREPAGRALARIWTDLSRETRLLLGAELLPLRDTSHWLEVQAFGVRASAMRCVQLGLYLGAVLGFRGALRRALGAGVAAELAAWLFALHPLHVESVAWLAGRKDVLALLFVGAALFVHAGTSRARVTVVPALLGCAMLSKSMSVAALGLLPAIDWMARRRPDRRTLTAATLVCLPLLLLHMHVGRVVAMTTPPAGGSRWTAAATMGPVWLRYLWSSVFPPAASIVHDVPVRTSWDALAVLGWAVLLGALVAATWLLVRRRRAMPIAIWVWFFVPLAPVSQLLFPLQNLMADRYLFLSVMAPCLVVALFASRLDRAGGALALVLIGTLALSTARRASLFSDTLLVFDDALRKTTASGVPPFQMGRAYEERGMVGAAELAYREALRRARGREEIARKATNNLSKLLARDGRLVEAASLLERGHALWPDDPQTAANLAEVLARLGRKDEARALCADVVRRSPGYQVGVDRCARILTP